MSGLEQLKAQWEIMGSKPQKAAESESKDGFLPSCGYANTTAPFSLSEQLLGLAIAYATRGLSRLSTFFPRTFAIVYMKLSTQAVPLSLSLPLLLPSEL